MATGETGFDDVTFDLVSVQYHALKAGHDYGQYVRDADNAGQSEIAEFANYRYAPGTPVSTCAANRPAATSPGTPAPTRRCWRTCASRRASAARWGSIRRGAARSSPPRSGSARLRCGGWRPRASNRLVPEPGTGSGTAHRWLRARCGEQDAVLAELVAGVDVPIRPLGYLAAEPVGPDALAELAATLYGDADPLAGPPGRALLDVRRTAGVGTDRDSEFVLDLHIPGVGAREVDLTRISDDLAVTLDGRRRMVALPPVLCRCVVTGADLEDDVLTVTFRPDPDLWMQ